MQSFDFRPTCGYHQARIKHRITFAPEQIVITRHGKLAGVLIGFETEDDWFEYRLENDPRFLKRIEWAGTGIRACKGIPWQDIQADEDRQTTGSGVPGKTRREHSR